MSQKIAGLKYLKMENVLEKEQQDKKPRKNTTLLFFEALACMMIVLIHCKFPGDTGQVFNGFAKFGVPFFFVVSGFFMVKPGMTVQELRKKIKIRFARVAFLLLFSFIIYFALDAIEACCGPTKTTFGTWIVNMFSLENIIYLLIFNKPITVVINWFMIAMLYSYLIIFIFPKIFIQNKWVPIILTFLAIAWNIFRIIVKANGASLFGIKLSEDFLYRSWYACGLLFISMGIVLKRYEEQIKKIPLYIVVPCMIIFMVTSPIEHFLMIKWLGSGLSYYFSSIFYVLSIMVFSVKKPDLFFNSKLLNQKGNWTRFVYIFHPAIIFVTGVLLSTIGIRGNPIVLWVRPIMTVVLSFATAMGFNILLNLIGRKIE